MARLRSSLSNVTGSPFGPLDALRGARLCRAAWLQRGLLCVSADDPTLNWEQRAFVRQIGERKFGRRVVDAAPVEDAGPLAP